MGKCNNCYREVFCCQSCTWCSVCDCFKRCWRGTTKCCRRRGGASRRVQHVEYVKVKKKRREDMTGRSDETETGVIIRDDYDNNFVRND